MTLSGRLNSDSRAFMQSCALVALAELDLATLLLQNGNRLSAQDLAKIANCDLRGCEALLNALCGMGYLEKGDGLFSVKPEYAEALDSRSPNTSIPIIRHMGCIMRSWNQLARSVRDGKPEPGQPSILGPEEDCVSFIAGMNSVAMSRRDQVFENLAKASALPEKGSHILDVGGASGTYTEKFIDLVPESRAVIFDLPQGIEQAKKRFGENHPRVSLITGDFMRDNLPENFDYAWLSAIIHQMNREESRMLYGKILRSLKPGGKIAIRDYIMEPDGVKPLEGALFGLNMLARTENGRVYNFAEVKEDLEQAGFEAVELPVASQDMSSVVTAQKPA